MSLRETRDAGQRVFDSRSACAGAKNFSGWEKKSVQPMHPRMGPIRKYIREMWDEVARADRHRGRCKPQLNNTRPAQPVPTVDGKSTQATYCLLQSN